MSHDDQGVAGELARFDDPKLEALVEMMVLAASADGEFAPEERARLEQSVLNLTSKRFSDERSRVLLRELEGRLEREGRQARLAAVRDALGDVHVRKVALELAVGVMAADGVLRTSERELILETAEALDLDRDFAADLVKGALPG